MLILYCQQFAFAPEMVGACAHILTCRDTQLHYRFAFEGHYDGHYEAHHEPHSYSTHGIDLNFVGGNVETPHGTNPELAAAAVSPYEAVIQVNGQSHVVPI
jgi:hypothetical protein